MRVLIESQVLQLIALLLHVHQVHHGVQQLHYHRVFLCRVICLVLTLYQFRVLACTTARFRVLHHLLYVGVEYLFAVSQYICTKKLHLLVLPWRFFQKRSYLIDSVLLLRGHSGASQLWGTPRFLKARENLLIEWVAADTSLFVLCLAALLNQLYNLERALDSQSLISRVHVEWTFDVRGIILKGSV